MYNAAPSNARRIIYGVPTSSNDYWENVSQSLFNSNNTTVDETDGWRDKDFSDPFDLWQPITKAAYDASNLTTDDLDGWQRKQVYSAPYDSFTTTSATTLNSTILTRFVAGNDYGVPALLAGGVYTNAEEANMYILPSFPSLPAALQAVALAQCGGTVTIQTRVGAAAASDPFTYQNTATISATGASIDTGQTTVTTTGQFKSGTFDFTISNGQYVTVTIVPQNLSDLVAYQPSTWSCKAGATNRSLTLIPVAGTPWSGFSVQVAANEAVSCIQTVVRVSP